MARPGDWSPLGLHGDPAPGDPDVLQQIHTEMKTLGDLANEITAGLNRVVNESTDSFVGKTAEALRDNINHRLKGFIEAVGNSFSEAESATLEYMNALRDIQAKADQALAGAQGLAKDDPNLDAFKIQVHEAQDAYRGAVRRYGARLHEAGKMVKQPLSPIELFFKALGILGIILAVLGAIFGGVLGVLAFAVNMALFIKAAVDFAEGKASGLELGLAVIGILFPSTRGILSFTKTLKLGWAGIKALPGAFTGGISTVGRGIITGITSISFKGVISAVTSLPGLVVRGLNGAVNLAVTGGKAFGQGVKFVWAGVKTTFRNDYNLATLRVSGSLGKLGLYSMSFGSRFLVSATLPLNFFEMGVSLRGAVKMGLGTRLFNPTADLAQPIVGGGLHIGAGGGHLGLQGLSNGTAGLGGLGHGAVHLSDTSLSGTRFATPQLDALHGLNTGGTVGGLNNVAQIQGLHLGAGVTPDSLSHTMANVSGLSAQHQLTAFDHATGFNRSAAGLLEPMPTHFSGDLDSTHLGTASIGGVAHGSTPGLAISSLPSVRTDLTGAGTGLHAAISDSMSNVRAASGHVEDFQALGFSELKHIAEGDITAVRMTQDGVSLHIGAQSGTPTSLHINPRTMQITNDQGQKVVVSPEVHAAFGTTDVPATPGQVHSSSESTAVTTPSNPVTTVPPTAEVNTAVTTAPPTAEVKTAVTTVPPTTEVRTATSVRTLDEVPGDTRPLGDRGGLAEGPETHSVTAQSDHLGVSAHKDLDLLGRRDGTGDTAGAAAQTVHESEALADAGAAASTRVALRPGPQSRPHTEPGGAQRSFGDGSGAFTAGDRVALRPSPEPRPHTGPGGVDRPPRSRFEAITGGVGGKIGMERLAAWSKYEKATADAARAEQHLHDLGGRLEQPAETLEQAAAKREAQAGELGVTAARQDLARLHMDVNVIKSRIEQVGAAGTGIKTGDHLNAIRTARSEAGSRPRPDTARVTGEISRDTDIYHTVNTVRGKLTDSEATHLTPDQVAHYHRRLLDEHPEVRLMNTRDVAERIAEHSLGRPFRSLPGGARGKAKVEVDAKAGIKGGVGKSQQPVASTSTSHLVTKDTNQERFAANTHFKEVSGHYQLKPVAQYDGAAKGKLRAGEDGIRFVATVPVALSADLDLLRLAKKYEEALSENAGRSERLGLVIGLNKREGRTAAETAEINAAITKAIEDFARTWEKEGTFHVSVTGFTWKQPVASRVEQGSQKEIPYGAIREAIARDSLTRDMIERAKPSSSYSAGQLYLHTGDADVHSMVVHGDPLFDRAGETITDLAQKNGNDLPPEVVSGGYKLPDTAKPAEKAAEIDLAVRGRMAEFDARAIYFPEPNTFVRISPETNGGLEQEIRFGVKRGDHAFDYEAQEGQHLLDSVIKTRRKDWAGDDATRIVVFDSKLALVTDGDRIAKGVTNEPDKLLTGLTQSHADPRNWKDRIAQYLAKYHPDIHTNAADLLAKAAFHDIATGGRMERKDLFAAALTAKERKDLAVCLKADPDAGSALTKLAVDTRNALVDGLTGHLAKSVSPPAPTAPSTALHSGEHTVPHAGSHGPKTLPANHLGEGLHGPRVGSVGAAEVRVHGVGDKPSDPTVKPGWKAARDAAVSTRVDHRWPDAISQPMGNGVHAPRYQVHTGFDVRTFDMGEHVVTDITVRVHPDGNGLPPADVDALWERAVTGVEKVFNPGHELSRGNVLHVTLERVDDTVAGAHLNVKVGDLKAANNQHQWRIDATEQDLAHEIGHQLGLRDEYHAPGSEHRADIDGSLMGNYHEPAPDGLPQGGMRDRYLQLINAHITNHTTPHTTPHAPDTTDTLAPPAPAKMSKADKAAQHAAKSGPDPRLKKLLVQPGYATGDQFGIVAALHGDPHLHVLLTSNRNDLRDRATDIRRFYEESGIDVKNRVILKDVNDYKATDELKEWQELNKPVLDELGIEKLSGKQMRDVLVPVGAATTWIGEHFSSELRDTLRGAWKLDDAHFPDEQQRALRAWLKSQDIPDATGREVVVLWSRFSGKRGDIHVEHDTSYTGMRQILEALHRGTQGSPKRPLVVITGDASPIRQPKPGARPKFAEMVEKFQAKGLEVHDLTDFWKREGVGTWDGDSRVGQMKLFEYLNRASGGRLRHLGFRSGNLEAMALSGHQVRYLEEVGSPSGDRMVKWHKDDTTGLTKNRGLPPGYERIQIEHPPTRSGQIVVKLRETWKETRDHYKGLNTLEAHKDELNTLHHSFEHPDWVPGRKGSQPESGPRKPLGPDHTKGFTDADVRQIADYLTAPHTTKDLPKSVSSPAPLTPSTALRTSEHTTPHIGSTGHGAPPANHTGRGHQGAAATFEAVRERHPQPIARNGRWTMWGRDGETPGTSVYAIENGSLGLQGVYAPQTGGQGLGEWHWHLPGEPDRVMVTPLSLPSPAPLDTSPVPSAHTPPRVAAEAAREQLDAALQAARWSEGLQWRADRDELYVFGPAGPDHPEAAFSDGLRPPGDRVVHVAAHVGEAGADDSAWLTATRDIGWLRGQAGDGAAADVLDRYGWRYDIAAPGGVDVNETLDLAGPHPERREVLYPGGVDSRYIRGAQRLERGRPVGPYLVNPGFVEPGRPDMKTEEG